MVNGREQVVAALRTEGLDQYIGVNHQSFGAYVREVAREVEDDIARGNASKPFEQQHVMNEEECARRAAHRAARTGCGHLRPRPQKQKGLKEKRMSQELTTIKPAPLALTLNDEQVAEHQEAFAMNVASGNVSAFDLPRIKVMSGAALWLIPGLENDEDRAQD